MEFSSWEVRKNLKRVKHNINLYHLSCSNHNGEVFHPRVPDCCVNGQEDTVTRRVCFSSTISGAYRAITFEDTYGEECYVHVPENIEPILRRGGVYKPSEELVFDSYFTGEYWIKRPVKMRCIGKAKFYYKEYQCGYGYYGCPWRPRVRFKWIEKY